MAARDDDGPLAPVRRRLRGHGHAGWPARRRDRARPRFTKGDALAGQVAGPPGSLPPVHETFTMDVDLLERIVGDDGGEVDEISTGEPLMLTIGTATTVGR